MGRWVRKFKLSKISFKQLPSLPAASLPLYEKALKKQNFRGHWRLVR